MADTHAHVKRLRFLVRFFQVTNWVNKSVRQSRFESGMSNRYTNAAERKGSSRMKKMLTIAAAFALALAGCAQKAEEKPAEEPEVVEEAAPKEEAPAVQWTDAADAAAAAKGAGFETFGVPEGFKVGDLEFKDPKFFYSAGVAKAAYETPATEFDICKADGTHETPLTERVLDEFATKWTKDVDGTEVTCYGAARGATTVATWKDGTREYGLTFQGLGGEEMSMESDELVTIVNAIKSAESGNTTEATDQNKTETTTKTSNGQLPTEAEAEALAQQTGGGNCTSLDLVNTKQYGDCWYAVVVDEAGNTLEYYITADGIYIIDEKGAQREVNTPANGGDSSSLSSKLSESKAREIAASMMDGEATDSYYTVDKTYGEGWHVTVKDGSGNVTNYLVNAKGEAYALDAKNV